MNTLRSQLMTCTTSYQKLKHMGNNTDLHDLVNRPLNVNAINQVIGDYNCGLRQLLEKHASTIYNIFVARPLVPWFDNELKEANRPGDSLDNKLGTFTLVSVNDVRKLVIMLYRRNQLCSWPCGSRVQWGVSTTPHSYRQLLIYHALGNFHHSSFVSSIAHLPCTGNFHKSRRLHFCRCWKSRTVSYS